ncbi:hypothetical protein LMG33818_000840 [Halomonadaceae bacterium LMG 33818]
MSTRAPHIPQQQDNSPMSHQDHSEIDRTLWERPTAAPELDQVQIEGCLKQYSPRGELSAYSALPDGLANGSWALRWEQPEPSGDLQEKPQEGPSGATIERGVLRVSARDHDAFRREARLLAWLTEASLAPALLHYEPDSVLGYPWEILEWRDGMPLSQALRSSFDSCALAKSIAENCIIRIQLKESCPIQLPQSSITQLPEAMDALLANTWVKQRLDKSLRHTLEKAMKHYASCLEDYVHLDGIAHGDFGGSNLLVSQGDTQTHLTALVDWEFASFGSLLTDLGNLLRIQALNQDTFIIPLRDAFNRAGFPLPEKWMSFALLADSMGWLYFLSRPLDRPCLFADCHRRIRYITQRV